MKKDGKWFLTFFLPKLPMFFLLMPLVALLRCLRPVCWIRFFPIIERIGHAAGDLDTYILERKRGLNQAKAIDIFFPSHLTAVNKQIVKLWSRVVPVSTMAHWLSWANMEIPGGGAHYYQGRPNQSRDIFLLTDQGPAQVAFTPREEERGESLLRSMGIPQNAKIVCIHGRDNAYLETLYKEKDWTYHQYRNFSIGSLGLTAEALVARGYYVVRMGRIVKEKFPFVHTHVIDYANSDFRNDFADIYLISKCYFFVGQSGIESVARLFRKPVVYINFVPITHLHTWSESFLSIFKLLWDRKEKRFLTFREMLKYDIHNLENGEFGDRALELRENSPEDIRGAVMEMEGRLRGRGEMKEYQEGLQDQFWQNYPLVAGLHGTNKSRIGTLFLEKYKDLLQMTGEISNRL